jgi:hypothetical protein
MGFNKRFVDKNKIETYLKGGSTLEQLFKADALIFMDSLASEVYKLYSKGVSDEDIKLKILQINDNETK